MSGTVADASVVSDHRSSVGLNTELVATRQWGETWTARDSASLRLQLLGRVLCCRNNPRVRWIRSKGAILVLLWNCLRVDYYSNLGPIIAGTLQLSGIHSERIIYLLVTLMQALSLILLYPLAGWIADVYFGRYRVITTSLWLMWAGALFLGSNFCISTFISPHQEGLQLAVNIIFLPVALLAMEVGIAGFHANAIPFGTDQLSTGSGDQLGGFITWFVFTTFIRTGIVTFPFSCPQQSTPSNYILLRCLVQVLLLSVVLILNSHCRDWFTVEPHTSNPFKLLAKVLNYARKNKYPQRRSAFTYEGHTVPSRIDFAKTDFGGPFSTEQVEDVRTFLRIVSALIPMGAALVVGILISQANMLFAAHVKSGELPCYTFQAVSVYFTYFVILCAVPLYEFLIHPMLYNYIPTMLTRIGMGIIFYLLSCGALFTVHFVAHSLDDSSSENYTCLLANDIPTSQVHINPLWTMLPQGLVGVGIVFNVISTYQFVFSQSPYNMKGLLMGAMFATQGAFQILGLAVQAPFYLGYLDAMTTTPTCGSVYLLVLLALDVVVLVAYVLCARGYRKRERGETKRQQDYPEEYYSKYLRTRR